MDCELCELVINRKFLTRHYYTDSIITIVDCRTCMIPMVVFRKHGAATEDERRKAMATISALFGFSSIRKTGRKILDHEHYHILGAVLR